MRSTLPAQLCVSHAVGLMAVSIVGTLMSDDPDLGEGIMVFVVGAIGSLFLFVPALLIALASAEEIYRNVTAFVFLGTLAVSAILIGMFGVKFGGFLALSPVLSSVVFFGLSRLDNPIADLPED
ncbi:MAG: hypothetical protein ACX930_04245 [Erythrobacter sp.]